MSEANKLDVLSFVNLDSWEWTLVGHFPCALVVSLRYLIDMYSDDRLASHLKYPLSGKLSVVSVSCGIYSLCPVSSSVCVVTVAGHGQRRRPPLRGRRQTTPQRGRVLGHGNTS